jgi:hypothetical protein
MVEKVNSNLSYFLDELKKRKTPFKTVEDSFLVDMRADIKLFRTTQHSDDVNERSLKSL